jgi:hypothetical protein
MLAAIQKSWQALPPSPAPPIASCVATSQNTAFVAVLTVYEATVDTFTYMAAIVSPQWDHWKRAMGEESKTILLNNTFSTLNSREAQPLLVKLIGSKWVYKTEHNPDGSTQYQA